MTPAREALLVTLACAVTYLTGAGDIPFYTRGEPREALVVREMVRGGPWLVPQRPDGELTRKPPLYYWTAAPVLRVLADTPELAMRLPSAVFATAAVLGTWATARAVVGPPAALPAALVLATTFEWMRAATSARVDMALAAAMTVVLAAWALALARGGAGWLSLAALGAGLGMLAKGPVALALPALAALALAAAKRSRAELRVLRPLVVLGVAAVLGGLWYVAAFVQEGGAFFDVVVRENWLRFLDAESGDTGHSHSVLYLLPIGLVGLLPWTPLLPLALASVRRSRSLELAAAWVATVFVFFSLASAKRSVYLLPLFPALALLVGAAAAKPPSGPFSSITRATASLYAPFILLLALATGALAIGIDVSAPFHMWLKPPDATGAAIVAQAAHAAGPALLVLALATLALVPAVAKAARSGDWRRLVVLVAVVTMAWTAAFDAILHPAIGRQRSVQSFMARVDRLVPADDVLHAVAPPDPGVRFYAPRPLEALVPRKLAAGGYLLLWEDEWRRLRDANGRPLEVLAVSETRQSRRGQLSLVFAARGPLAWSSAPRTPAPEAPGAAPPSGSELRATPEGS
jgi:4-amino-4-deoxy-L-arabinose transferase-like glycosyltransferase